MRAATALYFLLLVPATAAATPASLNYQGFLADADGAAVHGPAMLAVALYTVPLGGVPLWSDNLAIEAEHGLFTTALGRAANPLPDGIFSVQLWLGVAVDGDPEMTPRRPLTAVAYAFETANAQQLQGFPAAALDQSTHVDDLANPHDVSATQIGAASAADITALQAQLDALADNIAALEAALATEALQRADADSAEALARGAADLAHDAAIADLGGNTVLALDGILSLADANTALLTGVNLQVVNGTGATASANGLGNVIVGYNIENVAGPLICSLGEYGDQADCEANSGTWAAVHKTGSHNVIVGDLHNYSRYGGLATGARNAITGTRAAALGTGNTARGPDATILGGTSNVASGFFSSVLGGERNTASGYGAVVTAGRINQARGRHAAVGAGEGNSAVGELAAVFAGKGNRSFGVAATVAGGQSNDALATSSHVAGGVNNTANNTYAAVLGGDSNEANGFASAIVGGMSNTASGIDSSVAGGVANRASGIYSSVSGGRENIASGASATVTGGGGIELGNTAFANYSVVAGGRLNVAGDTISTDPDVGTAAVVSGGIGNTASGEGSVVSGGLDDSVSGIHDWRAGDTLFVDE